MIDPILLPILFNKLSKRVNQFDTTSLSKLNLSKIHVLYILVLARYPDGMTLREISEYIGFDKANTTRAMKHLIEVGYVKKDIKDDMKSKYKVKITRKGLDVSNKIMSDPINNHIDFRTILTDDELTALDGIIRKLLVNL